MTTIISDYTKQMMERIQSGEFEGDTEGLKTELRKQYGDEAVDSLDNLTPTAPDSFDVLREALYGPAMQQVQNAQSQAEQGLEATKGAITAVNSHLKMLEGTGAAAMYAKQALDQARSKSERFVNPGEQQPPVFPGSVYLQHLWKRTGANDAIQETKRKMMSHGTSIITDHLYALKTAINALGVHSDRNPSGIPVDIKDAKKIWFGSDDVDAGQEAEWRSQVENGDNTIDPKKVRTFVNYDGSKTWELLNDDKTVMSRFTMGELDGIKVFVQGGYNKFAEKLGQARKRLGEGGAAFEQQRAASLGGL